MAGKNFWDADPVAAEAEKWWEADAPAAKRDLPAGVSESAAGGGRGKVNPVTLDAQPDLTEFLKPDTSTAAMVNNPPVRRESVLEGQDMPDPVFSPRSEQEAMRLSNRDYARATPTPGTPQPARQDMRPVGVNRAEDAGRPHADSGMIVRAGAQAASAAGKAAWGGVRAVADLAGADGVAEVAREATGAARDFERGMGDPSKLTKGFGPDSPLPYLQKMGEGAAASLGTSAAYALAFGPKAVIPLLSIQSAGEKYDEARNAGLDPVAALANAIPTGAFEAIGERFQGLDKAAGALRVLMTRGAPAEAKRTAADVLVSAGIREVPGELVTYLGQTGVDLLPGIGINQDLTMRQFLEGMRDTVVQAGMMGAATGIGGAAAGGSAQPRKRTPEDLARAQAFKTEAERIERLRASGEKEVAATLQRRLDSQQAEGELERLADKPWGQDPAFQKRYRDLRASGVKPAEASARAAMASAYEQIGSQVGVSPKAFAKVVEVASTLPLEKVPAFLERFTANLVKGGMVPPIPSGTVESAVGAIGNDALTTGIQAYDEDGTGLADEAPAATPKAPEPPVDASIQGGAASNAAPEFDTGNDVVLTPEADAVHAAATSPLNDLPEPTDAQKDAGNYKVGRMKLAGLDVSIENPQGSVRRGTDASGKPWETPMRDHYGYVRRTEAADGDKLDVFVKPGTPEDYDGPMFVVDQIDPKTGRFDEHKVIAGAADEAEARAIYQRNYSEGWQGLGAITGLDMPSFKTWAYSDGTKTPLGKIPQAKAATAAAPDPAAAPGGKGAGPDARADRAGAAGGEGAAAVAPKGLRVGVTPADSEPVTVKGGVVHIGKSEAVDFDSGEPVRVPEGATPAQIKKALKDAGALSRHAKVFGGEEPRDASTPAGTSTKKPVTDAPRYGRDGATIADGGAPFKTHAEASKFKKKHMPQTRVVKASKGDGFVLRDLSDAELAANVERGRRLQRSLRSSSYDRNPLLALLAEHGMYHEEGKRNSLKADFSPDRDIHVRGYGDVFRPDGLQLDELATFAVQAGFLPRGAEHDTAALAALVERAISGKRVIPQYAEGAAEQELERQARLRSDEADAAALELEPEDLPEVEWHDASEAVKARMRELIAQAEAAGVDADGILEDVAKKDDNATQEDYYEAAALALEAALAARRGAGASDGGEGAGAGGATPREAEQAAAPGEGPAQGLTDRPALPAVRQQLFVVRGGQKFPVDSLVDASQRWQQFQTEAMRQGGGGASQIGNGVPIVDQDGKEVARISFNGRVWPPGEWKPGTKPLLEADGTPGRDSNIAPRAEQPRADYQVGGKDQRELIVQHNITVENLLHVDRIGGLAVPSLAITKADSPLDNFGEITLLGDEQMATPSKDTKVFGADVYSPRYPQVSHKLTDAQWKTLAERLKPFRQEGDGVSRWSSDGGDMLEQLVGHKPFQRRVAAERGIADPNGIGYHELRGAATEFLRELGAQERLFQGFTYSGNRRYIEHTLDRVVKILKKDLRGGENFNYGAGSLRAKFTPQFRSIAAVRKSKDKLITAEAFDKIKDEINTDLLELAQEMVPDRGFRSTDTAMAIIEDAAKMGVQRAAKEYDVELSDSTVEKVREFMAKLRDLPTAYFEAKVLRAMDLGEFKAAVVPASIPARARAVLERKGLRLYEYGSPEQRAAVVKRAAQEGQNTLFEPQPEYAGAYETDLFGNPIPRQQALPAAGGGAASARPQPAGVRGDAQPAEAVPGDAAADAPGQFYVETFVSSPTQRTLGAARINSAADLAQATQYLYKSAVERFDAIVTDKNGKPLAVVGGFKGATTQTAVYPAVVVGEAIRVPGAANIWFSHNHPSGRSTLSRADEALNEALRMAFDGSGIKSRGLIAVARDKYSFDGGGYTESDQPIPPAGAQVKVPVYERELRDERQIPVALSSPSHAKVVAKEFHARAKEPGMLLLDAQNQVAGWIPLSGVLRGPLRNTGGLAAIYKALSRSNASGAIFVHEGELDAPARPGATPGTGKSIIENIGGALLGVDVRPLDAVNVKTGESRAERGMELGRSGVFFARGEDGPFYSALAREVEAFGAGKTLSPSAWIEAISGLVNKGKVKADEVEWSGIRDWLRMLGDGKVKGQQVLEFLGENGVQVQEVVKGAVAKMREADQFRVELDALGFTVGTMDGDSGTFLIRRRDNKKFIYDSGWDSFVPEDDQDNGDARLDLSTDEKDVKADELGRMYDQRTIGEEFDDRESDPAATRYSSYTLPGGENYRELLLTLPVRGELPAGFELTQLKGGLWVVHGPGPLPENRYASGVTQEKAMDAFFKHHGGAYKSGHWDEPNILAHIRMNERTDAEGKRVLFIEEIQSDWAQKGRREGFTNMAKVSRAIAAEGGVDAINAKMKELERKFQARTGRPAFVNGRGDDFTGPEADEWNRIVGLLEEANGTKHGRNIPAAPFVDKTDSWVALALKRIVKMAADEGFDRVAFVTGEQSADRYDLSKRISRVEIEDNNSGGIAQAELEGPFKGGLVTAYDLNGRQVIDKRVNDEGELADLIGKDAARKLLEAPPKRVRVAGLGLRQRELSGLDLKVGGEGMIAFYDKILPAAVNKLLAKVGGEKIGEVRIPKTEAKVKEVNWKQVREDAREVAKGDMGYDEFREAHGFDEAIVSDLELEGLDNRDPHNRGRTGPMITGFVDMLRQRVAAGKAMKQPGFTITPAMRERVAQGLPLFARPDEKMPSGLTMREAAEKVRAMRAAPVAEVQAIVDSMTAGWKAKPKIHVVASAADFPVAAPPDARGLYYDGEVWIAASGHRRGQDLRRRVARTLAHEAIAHLGLRNLLGADFDRLLVNPVKLALASGNKPLGEIREFLRRTYVDKDGRYTLNARDEADEIAARAVEQAVDEDGNFRPGYSFLKAVWAKIAQALRDLGIKVEFTNAELHGMLVLALRGLEVGKRTAGGGEVVVAAALGEGGDRVRELGLPADVPEITSMRNTNELKAHPDYTAAKAGDVQAAARLVQDLVKPEQLEAARALGEAIWAAPHAQEASGPNAIPNTLAVHYAGATGGSVDESIVQANRTFHTGAPAMQRLIAPPHFDGEVKPGGRYVLVDDVTTMGGTLAELANFIRSNGGEVVGVVTLANASRTPTMTPTAKQIAEIERRYGQALREHLHIAPDALTRAEATYVLGFRDADSLRNRAASARQERADRLRAKGIGQEEGLAARSESRTVEVDGQRRPAENSLGQPIHPTFQGTVNFWRWFGDSKVVDDKGRPLVMYHGTRKSFDKFDPSKRAYFAQEPTYASSYTAEYDGQPADGANVMPVYLRIRKLADFTALGAGNVSGDTIIGELGRMGVDTDALRKRWAVDHQDGMPSPYATSMPMWMWMHNGRLRGALVAAGFDGAKQRETNFHGTGTAWVALDTANSQVKSATGNRGTFNPDAPGILFARDGDDAQGDVLGSYDKDEALAKQEREEAARRQEQAERDAAGKPQPGKKVTADQVDLFNPQGGLFARGNYTDLEREALDRAGIRGKRSVGQAIRSGFDRAQQLLRDRGELWSALRQGNLDQFHGIDRAVRADLGGLPTDQDPYVAARLANGGTSGVMRALLLHGQAKWATNGQHLEKIPGTKGLLDILAPLGDDLNDWFGWMVGNRAARLKTEGREHNLTDAQIKALQGLAKGKEPQFRKAAAEYAAFKRSVLDVAEQAGLIDPDGRKAWDHADHIPFYRQIDAKASFSPTGRKGLAGQSSGIRVLKGGEQALNDPMENLLMNFSRLIDASLKNNAIRKTVGVLKGTDRLEKVGYDMASAIVPKAQVRKVLIEAGTPEAVLDAMPDSAFEGMAKLWAIQAPSDPDVVRVMVGGKPQFYRVADPLLLKALTSFVPFDFPGLFLARGAKRILTRMVTSTPDFMLRNFIRDSVAAHGITRHGFNPAKSLQGILKSYTESGAFEPMLFAGASFQAGNVNAADPTGTAQAMRRALRTRGLSAASADSFLGSVMDRSLRGVEHYFEVGEAVENANREAVYEATLKGTGDATRAAYEAKDLMDFSLRGSSAIYQLAADVLPFFNARVQGMYRLGRSDPKRLLMVGMLMMTASLLLAMANDGEDWYEELEDWDKDTFWHFMVGGKHFRLPKPFEFGVVFATFPERIGRSFKGLDSKGKTADRAWANVRDQLAIDPVPQLFKPPLEVWANKDRFRDRPIETLGDEGKLPSARFNATTSDTARVASQAMAPVSDKLGLSPKALEHMVHGYFGTVGNYALALSDMLVRKLEDQPARPELRLDDMPVVKSFYREHPARATIFESELYKMRDEVTKIANTIRAYRNAEDDARADALEQREEKKLDVKKDLDRAAKQLADMRKERDEIMRDRAMTPAEKRKAIDALQVEKNLAAKEVMTDPAVREAQ